MDLYSSERPNLIESETGKKITNKIIQYTQTIKSQTTDLWTTVYTAYIKPHKQLLFIILLITVFLYYRYQMNEDDDFDDDFDKEEIIKYRLRQKNKEKIRKIQNYTLNTQTIDADRSYPIIDNYTTPPTLINKQTHDMGKLIPYEDGCRIENNNTQNLQFGPDFLDEQWEETIIPPYLE